MKRKKLILLSIAAILWGIGTIFIYEKGESNTAIVASGIIILIGFVTQIKKDEK